MKNTPSPVLCRIVGILTVLLVMMIILTTGTQRIKLAPKITEHTAVKLSKISVNNSSIS